MTLPMQPLLRTKSIPPLRVSRLKPIVFGASYLRTQCVIRNIHLTPTTPKMAEIKPIHTTEACPGMLPITDLCLSYKFIGSNQHIFPIQSQDHTRKLFGPPTQSTSPVNFPPWQTAPFPQVQRPTKLPCAYRISTRSSKKLAAT